MGLKGSRGGETGFEDTLPRSKGGTLPDDFSLVRNVVTPMESQVFPE
jgi:hypothetical protein